VVPAPAGNRVLVLDGASVLVTDVRGANPVSVDAGGFVGDYNWSPAGDRLVGGVSQKEPFRIGFAVVDARTGEVRKQWIDADRYDCSQCTFTWTRDGKEVALPIADRSAGEAEERVAGLQLFDAETGRPTRALPVTGSPPGPFSWSPDGRRVMAAPPMGAPVGRLYDATTGQSRPFQTGSVWVTDDVLLVPKDGKVLTLTPDGTVTATTDIPGGGGGPGTMTLGPPG
jgi:dipeptidyl aminopeptidase/acylaminoacyl peptidase